MIVYIGGPMTGYDDYNRPAFEQAAKRITENGDTPLNPATLPTNLPQDKYMPICMAMLEAADVLCLIDGWRDSLGAVAERSYALRQGKPTFDGMADYEKMRELADMEGTVLPF